MSNKLEIKSMPLTKFLELVNKNTTDFYTKRTTEVDDNYYLNFYRDISPCTLFGFRGLVSKAYAYVDKFWVQDGLIKYTDHDLEIFLLRMSSHLVSTLNRHTWDFSTNENLILVFSNGIRIELKASETGTLTFLN